MAIGSKRRIREQEGFHFPERTPEENQARRDIQRRARADILRAQLGISARTARNIANSRNWESSIDGRASRNEDARTPIQRRIERMVGVSTGREDTETRYNYALQRRVEEGSVERRVRQMASAVDAFMSQPKSKGTSRSASSNG